jgi:DNA relaxase NicK
MLRTQNYINRQVLPIFFNYDSVPDDDIRNILEYLEKKHKEYDKSPKSENSEEDDFLIDDQTDSVTAL